MAGREGGREEGRGDRSYTDARDVEVTWEKNQCVAISEVMSYSESDKHR